MSFRITSILSLTLCIGAASLSAQGPRARAIPKTTAGTVLGAWLDAFNSADSTRMSVYYRRYQPAGGTDSDLPPREEIGGLRLVSIERSEPRRVEFTLQARSGSRRAYGVLEVSRDEPPRVTAFRLRTIGENVEAEKLRIDAATRRRVIEGAIAQLDTFYVFPVVAKKMGDSLRARLARGAYAAYDNALSFAARLNDDLRDLARDRHLRVEYMVHHSGEAAGPSTEEAARQEREWIDSINCGFVKAELLAGNVGYLKFDIFAPTELCASTATAAMNFLAATRALILDLRDNGGGNPSMVAYLSSYILAPRTHLNDLWTRHTGTTEQFWTNDSVPGRRFGGAKPVYVLTSARTFSAAEEFAYNLKSLKRAMIVGETTGGGAHPVMRRSLAANFAIGVPMARAINPVTHTNWEGVGVEPDVKVAAKDAMEAVQKLLGQSSRRR
jgi:hypothetical protein